jgi:hypothetical protein
MTGCNYGAEMPVLNAGQFAGSGVGHCLRNATQSVAFRGAPKRRTQCAIINCRQSVVYAGDWRSNLILHAPLLGIRAATTSQRRFFIGDCSQAGVDFQRWLL